MPVGLDTAIIPDVPGTRADLRRALKLAVDAKIFVFVGRLDAYKKPLDLVPLLEAAPDWQAVIIGQGTQGAELARLLAAHCRPDPSTPVSRLIAALPEVLPRSRDEILALGRA